MVGTRGRHNKGEKRKLTASQKSGIRSRQWRPTSCQSKDPYNHQGVTRFLQVQWLFTVTPRHQNTLQLFSEDFAENLHGVTQRKDSLLRIQLHHSLLPPKLQASHLISQAQLFHHQRVRKCHLTGLSERWNETIQERVLVNRCHLQSKLQKDVHKKKKRWNCFRIVQDEWSKLLLYRNTNNKRHLPLNLSHKLTCSPYEHNLEKYL